jgi:hypothetical protein
MKNTLLILSAILLAAGTSLNAQPYAVGDTVNDYSFTDYRTGESVSLYDLGAEGGILVLEWFAWWCPFCANAAANVETGIVGHYAGTGGNPHGLPVKHISLNVQGNARSQSDQFISSYNLGTVLEDYQRSFFNLFSPGGGQPLFVVINAEPDSPSAARWEVLFTRLNYASGAAPDISALMRPVIDAIEAGGPGDPVATLFPAIEGPVDGWYTSSWLGRFSAENFPMIQHEEHGMLEVGDAGQGNLYLRSDSLGWLVSGPVFYPFLYSFTSNNWLYYLQGTSGIWFFDYALGNWREVGGA